MEDSFIDDILKHAAFWGVGIVLASVVWLGYGLLHTNFPSVSHARWQAVFLSNNQVYFGKLQNITDSYVALSSVYYLRSSTDLDQAQKDSPSLNLIKLGGELHGPEDVIYIPKSSVLFWENMKDSSRVVQTIITSNK